MGFVGTLKRAPFAWRCHHIESCLIFPVAMCKPLWVLYPQVPSYRCGGTPTAPLQLLAGAQCGQGRAAQPLRAVGTVLSRISLDVYHLLGMSREARVEPTGSQNCRCDDASCVV